MVTLSIKLARGLKILWMDNLGHAQASIFLSDQSNKQHIMQQCELLVVYIFS